MKKIAILCVGSASLLASACVHVPMVGVSEAKMESVQIGMTITEVWDTLAPTAIGEPPCVSLSYPRQEGGSFELMFFPIDKVAEPLSATHKISWNDVTNLRLHAIVVTQNGRATFFKPTSFRGQRWPIEKP